MPSRWRSRYCGDFSISGSSACERSPPWRSRPLRATVSKRWVTRSGPFHREKAEHLLSLSPELFTEGPVGRAPEQWKSPATKGLRRLFLVDFMSTEFGSFLVYDEREDRLRTPIASD